MLFKKDVLKEEQLGYWEEKSYMLVVPKDENKNLIDGIFDKVAKMDGVKLLEKKYLSKEEPRKYEVKL